jgi:hypothetical protein
MSKRLKHICILYNANNFTVFWHLPRLWFHEKLVDRQMCAVGSWGYFRKCWGITIMNIKMYCVRLFFSKELTEEGLPFLLFFRDPNDKSSEKMFIDAVILLYAQFIIIIFLRLFVNFMTKRLLLILFLLTGINLPTRLNISGKALMIYQFLRSILSSSECFPIISYIYGIHLSACFFLTIFLNFLFRESCDRFTYGFRVSELVLN